MQRLPVSGTAVVTAHSQDTTFLCPHSCTFWRLQVSVSLVSLSLSVSVCTGGRQDKSCRKSLSVEFYLGMGERGGREIEIEVERGEGGGKNRSPSPQQSLPRWEESDWEWVELLI